MECNSHRGVFTNSESPCPGGASTTRTPCPSKCLTGLGIDVDLPQVLTVANGTGTENSNLVSRQYRSRHIHHAKCQTSEFNLGEDLLSLRTGSEVGL